MKRKSAAIKCLDAITVSQRRMQLSMIVHSTIQSQDLESEASFRIARHVRNEARVRPAAPMRQYADIHRPTGHTLPIVSRTAPAYRLSPAEKPAAPRLTIRPFVRCWHPSISSVRLFTSAVQNRRRDNGIRAARLHSSTRFALFSRSHTSCQILNSSVVACISQLCAPELHNL